MAEDPTQPIETEQGTLDLPAQPKRIEVDDGRYGWRTEQARPIANRTDSAWDDLNDLREEARALGIEVSDDWPINRLQREIARHRPAKHRPEHRPS